VFRTVAPSSPILLPEKLRVFKNAFVGSTWDSALTPVAVIPLAEKSTISALCLVQGTEGTKNEKNFQDSTVGSYKTLQTLNANAKNRPQADHILQIRKRFPNLMDSFPSVQNHGVKYLADL
jgi:hypothetical protein